MLVDCDFLDGLFRHSFQLRLNNGFVLSMCMSICADLYSFTDHF